MDTCKLVFVIAFKVFQGLGCTDVSHTATRDDTFLDCRTGCVQCILYPVFLLFHLDLGSRTYIEDCYTAGEFAETFLEFLPVIIGSSGSNLLADEVRPFLDGFLVARTVHDSRIFLGDDNLLGTSEHVRSSVLKSKASFLGNHDSTGKGSYILKHFLTTVTEARSLYGSNLQCTAEPVHYQCGEGFPIDILCDDEQ